MSSAKDATLTKPANTPGGIWWRPRGGVDPVHEKRRGQTGHIQHRGGPQQPFHPCVLAPWARHHRHRPPTAGAELREPDGRVSKQPGPAAQQRAYGWYKEDTRAAQVLSCFWSPPSSGPPLLCSLMCRGLNSTIPPPTCWTRRFPSTAWQQYLGPRQQPSRTAWTRTLTELL